MKTELETLKVSLLLAERSAAHPEIYNNTAVLGEVKGAKEAFDRLEERYNSLVSQTPPEWQKTNWHLAIMANVPLHAGMAEIFAKALRQLPWPPGILVRWCPADLRVNHCHEFVVHHESQEVGIGMEVIDERRQ